jgi:hypothetical protein
MVVADQRHRLATAGDGWRRLAEERTRGTDGRKLCQLAEFPQQHPQHCQSGR